MTAGDTPVARLAGVTHRYKRTVALDDVSAAIPPGCVTGIIGPDGVGKSTLLALIAGVRKIQTGAVEVLGGDLADGRHRMAVCSRTAYMPQGLGSNLYPTLSVTENIDFFGRLFGQSAGERAMRIAHLLESTGLAPFAERPAAKLSGGMRQKLALCCALIHDPDFLILDEPTTGVDPLSRRQFWDLIDRIRARRPGMSVVVATAYMEEAEGFDHLIAMADGAVLATGSPRELRERAGTETLEGAFVKLLHGTEPERREVVRDDTAVAADGPPAIEATELTKRFGDFTAVDRVSFRIRRGEIFGFLGSNGCGKTTTMKMLTGLLPPSAGTAELFGKPIDAHDIASRRNVGYMSQSFSLYAELTVLQNLELHARLFHIADEHRAGRVEEMIERCDLVAVSDALPGSLPLGVRQRLQLAVAIIHRPALLILDEPTSGVDPLARDAFWDLLVELSRRDGVTIFISTHFVNEAERCDRVCLMHAGRILAIDTPEALRREEGRDTLEDVFIDYLGRAAGDRTPAPVEDAPVPASPDDMFRPGNGSVSRLDTLWAFARREGLEIMRDPIRLSFALIGPIVLMIAMGLGISFDVESLTYAVLDQDRTRESRGYLESYSGSRYFDQKPGLNSFAEVDRRLKSGDINVAIVVPPGFGRDLVSQRKPEVAAWFDGSNTFRAETARGHVQGVHLHYLSGLEERAAGLDDTPLPAAVETRFRYNQAFLSVYAIPPGVLMMLLVMIPAMLTAVGIVREKELGSISNLYAAPAGRMEFLVGKQLPYIAIAMVSFVLLVALMLLFFGVQLKGDPLALTLGAFLFVTASTAFGLVVSAFVRSQIAAIFATSILVMIPTVNFSGMMYPVSTLDGGARAMGLLFPSYYFQQISSGVFNKGLGLADLWPSGLALVAFAIVFWGASAALLPKQEA